MFKKLNVSPILSNFVLLAEEKRKLHNITDAFRDFQKLMKAHRQYDINNIHEHIDLLSFVSFPTSLLLRSEVDGVITTATALEASELAKITQLIKTQFLRPEEKLALQTKVRMCDTWVFLFSCLIVCVLLG